MCGCGCLYGRDDSPAKGTYVGPWGHMDQLDALRVSFLLRVLKLY